MGGRRPKKMSLKRKQANQSKHPSLTFQKLVDITQRYLIDLETKEFFQMNPTYSKTMLMERYRNLDER